MTLYNIAIAVQYDPRTIQFQMDHKDLYSPEYYDMVMAVNMNKDYYLDMTGNEHSQSSPTVINNLTENKAACCPTGTASSLKQPCKDIFKNMLI